MPGSIPEVGDPKLGATVKIAIWQRQNLYLEYIGGDRRIFFQDSPSHELRNEPPWAFISALYQKLFSITPNNYGCVWCDGPMGPVLGPARTSGPDLGRSWDQTVRLVLVLVLVLVGPGPAQLFFGPGPGLAFWSQPT